MAGDLFLSFSRVSDRINNVEIAGRPTATSTKKDLLLLVFVRLNQRNFSAVLSKDKRRTKDDRSDCVHPNRFAIQIGGHRTKQKTRGFSLCECVCPPNFQICAPKIMLI